jgi:uncharacterized protein
MHGKWIQTLALYAIARRGAGGSPPPRASAVPLADLAHVAELAGAARAHDAQAQYALGVLCLTGRTGTAGQNKCRKLLAAAALQNHPDACYVLALLHQNGVMMPQNSSKAAHLFQRAAKYGHARAMTALAQQMLVGDGVARDTAGALRMLEAASAQGLVGARANLGVLLLHGCASEADIERGLTLIASAARDRSPDAQHYLAWLYEVGVRVPQNTETACRWYELAADSGKTRSQYSLAVLLLGKSPSIYDPVSALKWLLVVATSRETALQQAAERMIDRLAPRLNPGRVAAATDSAIQWLQHRAPDRMQAVLQ